MSNSFVHVELNTTDVDKAKAFYGKLFQWTLEDIPGGDYTLIKAGQGTGGGMMKHPIPGAPSTWLAYVEVADIKAATEKAKSLGASIKKDVKARSKKVSGIDEMAFQDGVELLGRYKAYMHDVQDEECPRDALGNDEFDFMGPRQ